MNSTPSSHRSNSSLRLNSSSRISRNNKEDDQNNSSPLSLQTSNLVPLKELLLLSPSPLRKSRTRLPEKTESLEEPIDLMGSRSRRCKSRGSPMGGLLSCGSPRNSRRTRRRLDQEIREEREIGLGEDNGKTRKRRQSNRFRKEKLSLVLSTTSLPSPKTDIEIDDQNRLNHIWQLLIDLIMWKDVSKSIFWFGLGSLFFLSSCFARSFRFSVISAISQLGLLFLAATFFHNSFSKRQESDEQLDFNLKEDDILRLASLILPFANLVTNNMRKIFSGKPSMTLKVAPILLLGAEYGDSITLWRLCLTGFFVSFTVPKIYSSYSEQLKKQVEYIRDWLLEAWGASSHKKIVAASAVTVFWNLSSIKARIFSAFISVVILRYYRQQVAEQEVIEVEQQQHQALVLVTERSQ